MESIDLLDPHTRYGAPKSERPIGRNMAMVYGNNQPLKNLYALLLPFLNPLMHPHRIPRPDFRPFFDKCLALSMDNCLGHRGILRTATTLSNENWIGPPGGGSSLLPPRLLNLWLHLIDDNQMPGIAQDLRHKAIFEAQAIEEIRLREDGILHMAVLCILREKRFHQLFPKIPDKEKIHFALRPTEIPGEEHQLHIGKITKSMDERTLPLHHFGKEGTKIAVQEKILLDTVILLAITVPGADETDPPEILQFTPDRVDLLTEEARQLTDEVFALGVKQERREKLHPGLRTEERLQNARRRHVYR